MWLVAKSHDLSNEYLTPQVTDSPNRSSVGLEDPRPHHRGRALIASKGPGERGRGVTQPTCLHMASVYHLCHSTYHGPSVPVPKGGH